MKTLLIKDSVEEFIKIFEILQNIISVTKKFASIFQAQLQQDSYDKSNKQSINPYCEQWNSSQECTKCFKNFEFSVNNTCISTCIQGTYYQMSSQTCVAVCDQNYDSQPLYGTCEWILECQIMQSFGNKYHSDTITGVKDISDKYFLSFDKLNIMLIWDKTTLDLVSKLRRLHQYPIDDVLFFQSKYLLSWSNSEIILWDIQEGDYVLQQHLDVGIYYRSSLQVIQADIPNQLLTLKFISLKSTSLCQINFFKISSLVCLAKVANKIDQIIKVSYYWQLIGNYSNIIVVNSIDNTIKSVFPANSQLRFIDNQIENLIGFYNTTYLTLYNISSQTYQQYFLDQQYSSILFLKEYNQIICRNNLVTKVAPINADQQDIIFNTDSTINCDNQMQNQICSDYNFLSLTYLNQVSQKIIVVLDTPRSPLMNLYSLYIGNLYTYNPKTMQLTKYRVEQSLMQTQYLLIGDLLVQSSNTQLTVMKQVGYNVDEQYFLQNIQNSGKSYLQELNIDQIKYIDSLKLVFVIYFQYIYVFSSETLELIYSYQINSSLQNIFLEPNLLVSVQNENLSNVHSVDIYKIWHKNMQFLKSIIIPQFSIFQHVGISNNLFIYINQSVWKINLQDFTYSETQVQYSFKALLKLNETQIIAWDTQSVYVIDNNFNVVKTLNVYLNPQDSIQSVKIDFLANKIIVDCGPGIMNVSLQVFNSSYELESVHTVQPYFSIYYIPIISCNTIFFFQWGRILAYDCTTKQNFNSFRDKCYQQTSFIKIYYDFQNTNIILPCLEQDPSIITFNAINQDSLISNQYKKTFDQKFLRFDIHMKRKKIFLYNQDLLSFDYDDPNSISLNGQSQEILQSYSQQQILIQPSFNILLVTHLSVDNQIIIRYFCMSTKALLNSQTITEKDSVFNPAWWMSNQPVSFIAQKNQINLVTFSNQTVQIQTFFKTQNFTIYLAQPIPNNQAAFVTESSIMIIDMQLNYTQSICEYIDLTLYQKKDIAFNQINQQLYLMLSHKNPDKNKYNTLAVVDINSCTIHYYVITLEDECFLSKKLFSSSLVYLNYGIYLYVYDLKSYLGKFLNQEIFIETPIRQFDNQLFLINLGILFIYNVEDISIYKYVDLNPQSIFDFSFCSELNYLIVLLQNELRIYDFQSMNLIKSFILNQKITMFTNKNSSQLYLIESNTANNNQIRILDLYSIQMTNHVNLPFNQYYLNYQYELDEFSNQAFAINYNFTIMAIDLRLAQSQLQLIPQLFQFIYISGQDESHLNCLYSKNENYMTIIGDLKSADQDDSIDEYYNLNQQGILAYIDSLNNKYKQIMYLNYTRFHMVAKKAYNNHYTLVANDFQIFCIQRDAILDTYFIQLNQSLQYQPYLLSNQENIFIIANNTIFDIQYSFDSKKIILNALTSLSTNVFPIDIIQKANNTAAVYADEKILYLSYSTQTTTYQMEGNIFFYFQKIQQDMFVAVTDLKLLVYNLDISSSGVYSLVMKCNIINNDILQFYLMKANYLIVSEDSKKRIALYQFDEVSQTYSEYQSIPYPCYSGNNILLSSQNTNYFAVSCSLQTNIYTLNQNDQIASMSAIQKQTLNNYYTVVKTLKGIKMNQFVIQQQYVFCSMQQKILILDLVSLSTIYEINLTNFIFLKLMYLGVDQTYDKFSIKGVQDYQRINFKFLVNNSTNINNSDQIQLPLCYINIQSNLTKKDQISLFDNLQMYKNTLNQQVLKIILQITLIDTVQLIQELQSDAYELKVFQDQSSQNQIAIQSLFSIKKQSIQYSGVSFQFPDNFNLTIQNRKKVAIQNSQFSSNTFNSGVFFQNIDQLIISNITFTIENILNKNSSNLGFIILSNISDVVISKLSISQIKKLQFRQFFIFKQITNSLFISDTIISDIFGGQDLENFITIKNTNIVQLEKFKVFNIIGSQGSYQKFIFQFQGVLNTILSWVQGNNFQNISFFFYARNYLQDEKSVYLTNDNLTFQNMIITNTNNRNSLFWINTSNFSLLGETNIFSNIFNPGAEGGVFKIQGTYANITNSFFINNQAANGGAIEMISIDFQASFYNCTFLKNNASQFGGAIYLYDTYLYTENTIITSNKALIGGGIYYAGFKPDDVSIFYSNDAEIYGKNVASNLLLCKTNINCDENCNITTDQNSTIISNYRSGSTLNFSFEIIDEENNQIIINKQKFNNYPTDIKNEIEKIKISARADYLDLIKLSNQQSSSYLDYNEDNKLFRLPNLQVVGNPTKNQKIELVSSYTYFLYGQNQTSNNYTIYFNFRNCQTGERQVSIDNIIQCIPCPNGFYSLVTISNQSSVECTICPPSAYHCEKDTILLKEGYWRSNEFTDNIYFCVNKPSNCKGSLEGNRFYCDEGKVGPLCESCDIYEKVWDTKYMKSGKYDCVKCNDVQNKTFVLPIIGIFLFILAYVVFSINMSIKMSKLYSYSYYFRMSKILVSNKSSMQDISSFYLKILLNYIQISLITNSYYLTLPPILAYFPDILSLPLQHFLNIFDCQFSEVNENIVPVVFLRVLWSYFLPFIFMLIIVFVYSILFCIQKCILRYKENKIFLYIACQNVIMNSSKKMMVYHLYNGLFFLLIFMQPSQVQILLSTISCKEIDNQMYIASDLTFQCYTQEHGFYVGTMIVPGLLLWIFVIPLVILSLLRKQCNRLDSLQVRFSFGFLYQEYKQKYYFWEFVKSYFKIGIVLIGTFLGDAKVAKLIIICLVLFIYQYITSKVQPYILIKLNKLDFLQINVLVLIALFNAFIEQPPTEFSKNLVIVLTIIIHNSFLLINLSIAIFLKIEAKFSIQILKLKIFLKARIPLIFKCMVIKKPINLIRVSKNWKKIIEFVQKTNFKNNLYNILKKGQKQIKKPNTEQNNLQQTFKNFTLLDVNKQKKSSKSIASPYKKSHTIYELFQFNSAAKFIKNSPNSRKSIRNANSLSDIKEEDTQFDAFKIARSQSLVQSNCLINQAEFYDLKPDNLKKYNVEKQEQNLINQVNDHKKSSIDNTSYIADENQKIKHSSKNLIQSQQDNPSFNSIQNSQSATKKNKTFASQRGFLRRFMHSQSRQTTQPGTPSELLISQYAKKQPALLNIKSNKSIKSTEDFIVQLQREDSITNKERANLFSNIDLMNSRLAFSNSNIKNIQSHENSINFNQATGSQYNFCSQQEKLKANKVKDQIKYTSSSSEESSEEQSEQNKNDHQFQQINQFDLHIYHYRNNLNQLISPSELVDNTIPLKYQYQNMTQDLQKESQVNQPELNSKNIFIPTPNVLSKLSLGDSIQVCSKRSINNQSPDIQQLELISFEESPQKKCEQNNNELVNFEDSQSSNSN
ncbi:hypothetical protein ABPG72_016805 [Tetrahymena utriculariae]